MTADIVLVDDDRNILTSVSMALTAEGYHVRAFDDSEEALSRILSVPPSLVVLDIKMPRMDGMEVLRRVRESSNVPVIFLTSRDDEIDEVLGLRMGADDYIKKPFSQRLLLERIRTLLRRNDALTESDQVSNETLVRADLVIDNGRHVCTWKGTDLILTVTEFLILRDLTIRPGHVKSRNQLIDVAYGRNIYVDDRTIDSHIKRIRRKFKEIDQDFNKIETLYGIGYRYQG